MKKSRTVLIDNNPGRNSQTFGIARELGTDLDLIHEPSVGLKLFTRRFEVVSVLNLENYTCD